MRERRLPAAITFIFSTPHSRCHHTAKLINRISVAQVTRPVSHSFPRSGTSVV